MRTTLGKEKDHNAKQQPATFFHRVREKETTRGAASKSAYKWARGRFSYLERSRGSPCSAPGDRAGPAGWCAGPAGSTHPARRARRRTPARPLHTGAPPAPRPSATPGLPQAPRSAPTLPLQPRAPRDPEDGAAALAQQPLAEVGARRLSEAGRRTEQGGGAKRGGGRRLLGNSVSGRKWLPNPRVSGIPNTTLRPPASLGQPSGRRK